MTVFEGTAMGISAAFPVAERALVERVETHRELGQIAPQWRALQANGLTTPYQTCDWVRAWSDAHVEPLGLRLVTVTCHDARGRAIALLPLCSTTRGGVRIARFVGGKHANMNMGLYEPTAMLSLSAEDLRFVLRNVAERHRIDLYHFENQPRHWLGMANPMALLPHQSSPSSAWMTGLVADGEEMIRGLMSSESRKKLRHKERKLGEFGAVSYLEARNVAEVESILGAFYQQKAERFKGLGISDPFSSGEVRAFLKAAATQGLMDAAPAVSLFAMKVGERIVSVFGGAIHQGRFSGMFTSFDCDPAMARYSPGDLLLLHLIKSMCARGLTAFDLGTGDAAYKTDYCKVEEPLFDSFLPVTMKGQAIATAMRSTQSLKRILKKSGFASSLLARVRQGVQRVSGA